MNKSKIAFMGAAILAAISLGATAAFAALPTVTGFTATSTSPTSVSLTWSVSADPAVAGYKIYQNGTQIATVTPISAASFAASGLTPNTNYIFGVSAYNSAETASLATTSATTLADNTAPSVPVITSATPVSPNQINLVWSASTDNVAVAGYKIYRDDSQISTTTGLTLADSALATSTTYKYSISAYDAAGNVSATSSSVTATTLSVSTPDTVAPTQPTNLSAVAVSTNQINLTWLASTDVIGVTGYKILRNGGFISNSTGASYNDTGLSAATLYSYNVIAYDAAGNLSATSSTASATTLATSSSPIGTTTARIRVIGNGNDGRLINLRSNAKIKVVVFGGSSFKVKDIDRGSVTFAGAPAVNNWRMWHNRDRFLDRVFEFRARDMKDLLSLASTTNSAEVSFKATAAGVQIEIKTTVRLKNLEKWHKDRDDEHEREEAKRAREQLKKEQERLREKAKEDLEKQRELMKQEQEKIREATKEIRNNLREDLGTIKKEIKDIKKIIRIEKPDKEKRQDKEKETKD